MFTFLKISIGRYIYDYISTTIDLSFRFVLTFNVIVSTGWPVGELILAFEAYLLRDHVILQLVSHAPMFFVIVVIFIGIPESTRWLISKKMYDQASKQVFKIAKINGTTAPKDMCDPNTMAKKVALEGCIDNGNEIFSNISLVDLNEPYDDSSFSVFRFFISTVTF